MFQFAHFEFLSPIKMILHPHFSIFLVEIMLLIAIPVNYVWDKKKIPCSNMGILQKNAKLVVKCPYVVKQV